MDANRKYLYLGLGFTAALLFYAVIELLAVLLLFTALFILVASVVLVVYGLYKLWVKIAERIV